MTEILSQIYNREVNNLFKSEGIRNFFLHHERKELIFKNISEQLQIAKWKYPHLTKSHYDQIIVGGFNLFFKFALESKEQQIKTDCEKRRLEDEFSREKVMDEIVDDIVKNNNVITEEHIERVI